VARVAAEAVREGALPPGWGKDGIGERLEASTLLLVALRHGQVIGFLSLQGADGAAAVAAVAVLPAFRGRGVGTALLDAARAELAPEGRPLIAEAGDERVARFFKRCGVLLTTSEGNPDR